MTYLYPDSASHEHGITGWDDLRVPANDIRPLPGGAAPPTLAKFGAGLSHVYESFANGANNYAWFNVQIPHRYKEGTDIEPHVHWFPTVADAVNTGVRWELNYEWVNPGSAYVLAAAPTNIGDHTPVFGGTATQYMHSITSLPAITGTSRTISSMLMCVFFRNVGHGSDNYPNPAGLLEFDFHFEVESLGSANEFTK